jgi:hypothetical protein
MNAPAIGVILAASSKLVDNQKRCDTRTPMVTAKRDKGKCANSTCQCILYFGAGCSIDIVVLINTYFYNDSIAVLPGLEVKRFFDCGFGN